MADYIVYQAYGHLDVIHECIFSLHSLAKFGGGWKVILYTDQKGYIQSRVPPGLAIDYRDLTPEQIARWRGEQDFTHRLKIEMLLDVCTDLGAGSRILYLDSDTTFISNPKDLFQILDQGSLLMHVMEGPVAVKSQNRVFRKVARARLKDKFLAEMIPGNQIMWNAGLLGFRSEDRPLLDEVLTLTDQMYVRFQKHVVEQLAFSIVFSTQEGRELQPAVNFVFHYWNFKEFRSVLSGFFAKYDQPTSIASNLEKIDPQRLIQSKLAYQSLPSWHRNLKKLTGKWKMPPIDL